MYIAERRRANKYFNATKLAIASIPYYKCETQHQPIVGLSLLFAIVVDVRSL